MRVLVTGGTGFIGRHLVRRLVGLGDEVACFVRRSSEVEDLERMGVEFRYGDVTDFESVRAAVRDVDAVYHLAGVIRTVGQGDMPAVNEGGTANLVKACAQLETPPAVVFVSSIAATGPSRDGPLVESDKPEPVSLYGRSKLAAERAARRWSGEVPVTTIRPPIVFGEHDKETLELFRMADRGWHVIPGLKARRVSLVHASDLAHLMQLAAEGGERMIPGGPHGQGVYFAGDEARPTFMELGHLLADAVGQEKLRVVPTPAGVTWGLAALAEVAARMRRRPSLWNIDKAREATAGSWTCDASKSREQLRMKMKMTLPERLAQTAQWYRNQGWL